MKRKTKWVLGLSLGIPIVLVGVLLLVLRLSSSNPESDLTAIEVKELPSVWVQEMEMMATDAVNPSDEGQIDVPVDVDEIPLAELPEEVVILPPTIEAFDLPIAGTLVMIGRGKPFGEEAFELGMEGDEVFLRSSGKFWFKALIATMTLKFEQVLQMDSQMRPMSLTSTFDAPLGFGRQVQADFAGGSAIVRSGDKVEEYPVDLERAYVQGTFGTYAVIPLLYEMRGHEGETVLETLVFGGPPSQEDREEAVGLPETRINRIEDTTIRFGDRELIVSQYAISGDMGTMTLYARGIEMLGLLAGGEEESMFVYRADYFEDGFTVIGVPAE